MAEDSGRIKMEPFCLATAIGSMPHTDAKRGTSLTLGCTPAIPSWVQFPKRAEQENMMLQFTEGIPGLVEQDERTILDASAPGFVDELTRFYDRYLAATEGDDLEALELFSISSEYAAGFEEFMARMPQHLETNDVFMLKMAAARTTILSCGM
jgi:hypothetical protein